MKGSRAIIRSLAVLILFYPPAFAQSLNSLRVERDAISSASTPGQAGVPGNGTIEGLTYFNQFFGLKLTIPGGWQVQDASRKQMITEKGKELMHAEDKGEQAQIEKSIDNTLNLLTISQYPLGSAVPFNPVFICGAEKIPATAGPVKDADYISSLKEAFQYSKVPVQVERETYFEAVGGVSFAVVDVKLNPPAGAVNQRYYTHIKKGYALFFILTYQTEEQLRPQIDILKTVNFQ